MFMPWNITHVLFFLNLYSHCDTINTVNFFIEFKIYVLVKNTMEWESKKIFGKEKMYYKAK